MFFVGFVELEFCMFDVLMGRLFFQLIMYYDFFMILYLGCRVCVLWIILFCSFMLFRGLLIFVLGWRMDLDYQKVGICKVYIYYLQWVYFCFCRYLDKKDKFYGCQDCCLFFVKDC